MDISNELATLQGEQKRAKIASNWLPRYTKRPLDSFDDCILLTNFGKYVDLFAEKFGVEVLGKDSNMPSASAEGITIINFGMGSPNAATIMDLLSSVHPRACLFLGKCGGIDRHTKIGDLVLPIAAIRGEETPVGNVIDGGLPGRTGAVEDFGAEVSVPVNAEIKV